MAQEPREGILYLFGNCVVCQEPISYGDGVVFVCGGNHYFHVDCYSFAYEITNLVREKKENDKDEFFGTHCPLCRARVPYRSYNVFIHRREGLIHIPIHRLPPNPPSPPPAPVWRGSLPQSIRQPPRRLIPFPPRPPPPARPLRLPPRPPASPMTAPEERRRRRYPNFHVGCVRMQCYIDHAFPTLQVLQKKDNVLLKKAAGEVDRAKEFSTNKNKRSAIQCLKRKKLYEQQIEKLGNFQRRIHDQMIMLDGAKATTETVDAVRIGAAATKAMEKATNIDDVDKTMDELNEQTENMKQIQEALCSPLGSAADFDEDELEAELEEQEGAELEEQLLQSATTAPAAPVQVPAGRQPTRPVPQKCTAEEEELAALQADMAP